MLEIKNLTYTVTDPDTGKETKIIDNISLTVNDRFVAVTGPNGGGKSTLAKLIAGIYTPDSGEILLDGVDITKMSITERAKAGISFAFQQPVRFKGITVRKLLNLAAGREMKDSELCDVLGNVGLCAGEYLNREVNSALSGGEIKRIEIASVLARGTKISIFDEPEAGIDLWSFANLIKAFQSIHKDREGTLIIISHQERILKIADEIVLLADGKLVASGSADEMMERVLSSGSTAFSCRKQEVQFQ